MKNKNKGFLSKMAEMHNSSSWVFFLIYIAFFLFYIGQISVKKVEPFTPQFRQLYRPQIRHLQDVYENFSNNAKHIMMKRLKMNNLY